MERHKPFPTHKSHKFYNLWESWVGKRAKKGGVGFNYLYGPLFIRENVTELLVSKHHLYVCTCAIPVCYTIHQILRIYLGSCSDPP